MIHLIRRLPQGLQNLSVKPLKWFADGTRARDRFIAEGLEPRTFLSADLLVNGNFENEPNFADSVSGYGVNGGDQGFSLLVGSQIPGWTIVSGHGVTVHNTLEYPVIGGNFGVNTDGEGYNGVNADLYQDFNTTNGSSYKLAFDYQGWENTSNAVLDVSLTDTVTNAALFSGLYNYDSNLIHIDAPFDGTGNPVRLEVSENPESGTNDDQFNVDNFSVTSSSSTLKVVRQPANASPGDPIDPGVRIAVLDDAGHVDTKASTTITASLSSDSTGTGVLTGTTAANTARGIANFNNLRISKPGQYVLNFTDSDGVTIPSQPFTVSTGKLIFKGKIRNGIPATALHPAIQVELVDKKGHKITDASSTVTLSIQSGPSGTTASSPITGNTATLVGGVAVFSSLKFAQPGDYVLSATDDENDASAVSNDFTITGLHLAFKMQPADVGVDSALRYKVAMEDYRNRLVNTSSFGLGLALNVVKNGATGVLSSLADTIDFGEAVNSGSSPAKINSPGTYSLTFTVISESSDAFDYTISAITSEPFNVVANHLVFTEQPKTTLPGVALRYEVSLKDYRDHTVTTNNSDQLRFTLIPSPIRSGVLASNVDTLSAGVATNANNAISVSDVGKYSLSVIDVPGNPSDTAAAGATSRSFTIKTLK